MLSNFGTATTGMARDKNALRRSFLSMVDEDDVPETHVHCNGRDMLPVDDSASASIVVEKIKFEDLWEETTSCGGDSVSEFSHSTKSSAWRSDFELSQKSLFQFRISGDASLHILTSEGSVPLADGSNHATCTSLSTDSNKEHATQDEISRMFKRIQQADSYFMHAEKVQNTEARTSPPSINRVDMKTEHVSMELPARPKDNLKPSCDSRQQAALRLFQHLAPAAPVQTMSQVPQVPQVEQVPQMPMKQASTVLPVHPLLIRPPPGLSLPAPGLNAPLPGLIQAPPGLTLSPLGLRSSPQSASCDEAAGMLGHPELCTRPCIFFAQGNCVNGNSCGFCHLPHPTSNGASNKSVREPHLDKRGRTLVKTMNVEDRAALIIPILEKKAMINGFQAEAQELLATLKAKMKPNPNLGLNSKLVNLTRSLESLSFRSLLPLLLRAESAEICKDTEVGELVGKLRRSVGVSLVKK